MNFLLRLRRTTLPPFIMGKKHCKPKPAHAAKPYMIYGYDVCSISRRVLTTACRKSGLRTLTQGNYQPEY